MFRCDDIAVKVTRPSAMRTSRRRQRLPVASDRRSTRSWGMRCLVFLVLLGGCTDAEPVSERTLTLDVVVAASGVTVYAASASAAPWCTSPFPPIGASVHVGDAYPRCEPSLFECVERITYAGTSYTTPDTEEPLRISAPPTGPSLVLEGCGESTTVVLPIVSLPPPPVVRSEVMHDTTNRVVDVDWDSDPRAATHLVTLGASLWSEVHHVAGSADRFTTPSYGYLTTMVQSLLPGREHITPLALVRVWPASEPSSLQIEAAPY